MTSAAMADDSELCLSCGLCCTGEIFEHVRLGDDEVEGARALRLPVVHGTDRSAFAQPCPHNVERACGVYEQRPRACRAFECHTLKAHRAGEIDRATAAARIERLRSAARAVRAGLPGELASLGLWAAVARFSDGGEGQGEGASQAAAWRAQHAGVLLDILALERLCRRDFASREG
ncbi:MAG: YkgJ family cysteine cluster protein [Polyangiaceae bacterium]